MNTAQLSESSAVALPRNVGWPDSEWAYLAASVAHLGWAVLCCILQREESKLTLQVPAFTYSLVSVTGCATGVVLKSGHPGYAWPLRAHGRLAWPRCRPQQTHTFLRADTTRRYVTIYKLKPSRRPAQVRSAARGRGAGRPRGYRGRGASWPGRAADRGADVARGHLCAGHQRRAPAGAAASSSC